MALKFFVELYDIEREVRELDAPSNPERVSDLRLKPVQVFAAPPVGQISTEFNNQGVFRTPVELEGFAQRKPQGNERGFTGAAGLLLAQAARIGRHRGHIRPVSPARRAPRTST